MIIKHISFLKTKKYFSSWTFNVIKTIQVIYHIVTCNIGGIHGIG